MLKSIRDYAITQSEPMLIRATHHRLDKHLAHQLQNEEETYSFIPIFLRLQPSKDHRTAQPSAVNICLND